jgi:hypothetical protein
MNYNYYLFFTVIFCQQRVKSLVLSRTAGLMMLLGSPSVIILAR